MVKVKDKIEPNLANTETYRYYVDKYRNISTSERPHA